MHNDCERHVKTAKRIATAVGQLLRLKRHEASDHVQLLFAGLNAYQAAAELGPKAAGKIFVLPTFVVVDNKVQLDRLIVVDGMSLPGRSVISQSDLVRHPQGPFGVLTREEGETYSYILEGSRAIIFFDKRRPWNSNKIIKAGRKALAKRTMGVHRMAA